MKNPSYVVAAAVACCTPMISGILDGNIPASTAAERFLVALIVCWVLGGILSGVYTRYSAQAQRTQILRMIDAERDPGTPRATTVEVVTKPEE